MSNPLFPTSLRTLIGAVTITSALLFSAVSPSQAKVMDNGVDPERLGTGDWIYFLNEATNHLGGNVESVVDVPTLMSFYKSMGLDFIAIKAGTGALEFPPEQPQFTKELVDAAHTAGIKIFGYSRSDGKDVPGEIELAAKIYNLGADGFIIDAEAEWEPLGQDAGPRAIELGQGIKKRYPNKFLAHAPMPIISLHTAFPYKEFGLYCDAVMPQDYWKMMNMTPSKMVARMDDEWRRWQESLSGSETNAIKPLAPAGHGWNVENKKPVTEEEIMEFVAALNHDKNPVTPGGYKGVSYWRTDLHTAEIWRGIKKARIGDPSSTPMVAAEEIPSTSPTPTVTDETSTTSTPAESVTGLILDDTSPSVTFTGDWFPGRMPGQHGDSYKCANAVYEKATATATYRPSIDQNGLYDIFIWYNATPNRSVQAPWVIAGAEQTITTHVDQTINGGIWFQIAADVSFSAGTDGYVSVSNKTGEEPTYVIIADAVRFVLKEKK